MEEFREEQRKWIQRKLKNAIVSKGLAECARSLVRNLRKGNMTEFDFVNHMRILLDEYEWVKGVENDRDM